jgi:hypothetical protein
MNRLFDYAMASKIAEKLLTGLWVIYKYKAVNNFRLRV